MKKVEFVSWTRGIRWTEQWHLSFLKDTMTMCSRSLEEASRVDRRRKAPDCCKLCAKAVVKILLAEANKTLSETQRRNSASAVRVPSITGTNHIGERSMNTPVSTASQAAVPMQLGKEHFRMSRTFKAFSRTRNDLHRLIEIGGKDRHAAVQAALHVLAAELCQNIGLTDAATNINQRYARELIPAALKAREPLVRGVGRKAKALPASLNQAIQEPPVTEQEPTPTKRIQIKDYKGKVPKVVKNWMRKKHPRGRPPSDVSAWIRKNLVAA